MSRPIDRLNTYLAVKNINPYTAEKKLDISNGYIRNQLIRKGQMGTELLLKITNTFIDLNLYWLVSGKGEMLLKFNLENDDVRLLEAYLCVIEALKMENANLYSIINMIQSKN